VVSKLFGKDGAITRLASEYRLPADSLQCEIDDVVVIRSKSGRPLSDIRSSTDSREVGEAISVLLAKLHEDPNAELHCSLAGGRKTMGALLALALQLCARPGDRLYHVLVSEPFDRIPDFYYPSSRRRYHLFEGERLDSRKARVDLAEIPIIRLGAVAQSLGLGSGELARRAQRMEEAVIGCFRPPVMEIDRRVCALSAGKVHIVLPPREFALYCLYAGLRVQCVRCAANGRPGCERCQPTDQEIYDDHRANLLAAYRQCRPGGGERLARLLSDQTGREGARTDFDDWLRQTRSKLNRRLRAWAVSNPGLGTALIQRMRTSSSLKENRRGLCLSPNCIRFRNVDKDNFNVAKDAPKGRARSTVLGLTAPNLWTSG
jgi:CRISPR-associated protein (TIGR02584 family)